MTPPSVLVDRSFLDALVDAEHERRPDALNAYGALVDAYARHEIRLRARLDHLERHNAHRRTLFAPIEKLSVARQHLRAAARLEATLGVPADVASTLVLMKRERIRRIATFDASFAEFGDIEVVGWVSSGTGPTTAPSPTDG